MPYPFRISPPDPSTDAMRLLLARLLARVQQDAALLELVLAASGPSEAALREQLAEHLQVSAELVAAVRADLARRRPPDVS